jgi:Glyoxalase-like domain
MIAMEIDHVVFAARTRDDVEALLSQAGLAIARGRTIPGVGLSNLVVPLGETLLEITYPNGEPAAAGAPPLLELHQKAVAARPADRLIPIAWVVLVEDEARLRELATANGMPVAEAPAEGPGFPPYTLAGFGATFDRPWLPLLIHWPVPALERPAALTAPHGRRPIGIVGIEVAGPADEITRWCGEQPRGLRTVPGTAGPQRVEVGFADGTTLTLGDMT